MRIIAGTLRGRPILPPASDVTRPITDRVKQSLFDILTPYLPGATVFDCFAGTGSLGLESLSRGAATATFFERDRAAVDRLRKNIQTLGLAPRARVIADDLFAWSHEVATQGKLADCIFLDPPYRFLREKPMELRQLAIQLGTRLTPDGFIVFRHDAGDSLELSTLTRTGLREYGGMAIEFLRPAAAQPAKLADA